MKTSPTAVITRSPLTDAENRNRTAIHVACDLLSCGLSRPLVDLHIALIQVVDAWLLDSAPIYKAAAQERGDEADQLIELIQKVWQLSCGHARKIHLGLSTMQETIDCFRQEQFWTKGDQRSLI